MLRSVFRETADTRSLRSALKDRVSAQAMLWVLNSMALAVPVVALIVLGYRRRWVAEDAFISLRVVRNIVSGYGPVFNIGERVEAHSNPLWVAILAFFGTIGADIVLVAVALGILLSAVGLFAALAGADRLNRGRSQPESEDSPTLLVPVGAIIFISVPVGWDFVTSGLESGLGFGWLGVSFWILVHFAIANRALPAWHWYVGALVLGLGPLVRPDFLIFSAGFLLALVFLRLYSREQPIVVKELVLLAASAAFLPVTYQIFRMGYYASLVPNPALAKEAGESRWEQGTLYLNDFIDPYWLWVPISLVLGWWAVKLYGRARQRDWSSAVVLAVPVVTALLHALYVVRVGGDFMHGRMLLPALFALLLPLAAVRVPIAINARIAVASAVIATLLVWAFVSASSLRSPHGGGVDPVSGIADERRYYVEETKHPNPMTLDDYEESELHWAVAGEIVRDLVDEKSPGLLYQGHRYSFADGVPSEVKLIVPAEGIGIFGFSAGPSVHLVDQLGLADPIAARLELENRGRPGHEKNLPLIWMVARFTSLDVDDVDDPRFVSARGALECYQLSTLTKAVTEPLTIGRFLENIRLSWSFHNIRVPSNPHEAVHQFCGSTPMDTYAQSGGHE